MGSASSKADGPLMLPDRNGKHKYVPLQQFHRKNITFSNDSPHDHEADVETSDSEVRVKIKKINTRFQEVSLKATYSEEEKRRETLRGNLDIDCHLDPKIVRIFTSSTFTDTYQERNRLCKTVYPKLRRFCHELGYEFQVVDMRWGVRDQATDSHLATELCLKEINQCRQISTGPFFVTFLSHKYGYRPLPRLIDAETFETLVGGLTPEENGIEAMIHKWYRKDENMVPAHYVLEPVSTHLATLSEDETVREEAGARWTEESLAIQGALIRKAEQVLGKTQADTYRVSITEKEILNAIGGARNMGSRCVWFHRVIRDINNQEKTPEVAKFLDSTGNVLKDREIRGQVKRLKEDVLKPALASDHIFTYMIPWTEDGIDPDHNENHRKYMNKLCEEFEETMKTLIQSAVEKKPTLEKKDELYTEVSQHASLCQTMCNGFKGRTQTLDGLRQYIQSQSRSPLVLSGESGCGKSSIMAMVAKLSRKWLTPKALILFRCLGTTTESSNVASLLRSLVQQMDRVFRPKSIPAQSHKRTKALVEMLKKRLSEAGPDRPVVILLDALDQLHSSGETKDLNWIPRHLPPHVKVVVSTLPDGECYENLKVLITDEKQFLTIPELDMAEAKAIVDSWLEEAKRTLTASQLHVFMNAFQRCQLPLFLKLSFEETRRWRSHDQPEVTVLQATIRESIKSLFSRLETKHGILFVSRTLGYLTLSKTGLSETELEDVLSCDDDVLNEMFQYWTPPHRRLPPYLLVRMRAEIEPYIAVRGEDQVRVITWFHRQFSEAAFERYCSDVTKSRDMHVALAEYFRGTWAGVAKPYSDSGSKGKADRLVSPQPLRFSSAYNLRKLNNLPYHLINAGQSDILKKAALINLEFLLAKLKACSLNAVLADFAMAREKFPHDEEIKLVQEALQLSQSALLYDENQLPSHLIGRFPSEKEIILGEPSDLPVEYLMPDKKILIPPGGQLVHCLAGHTQIVTCMDLTSDGRYVATASHDESVRVWDASKGTLHMLAEEVVHFPEHLFICSEDRVIVVNSDLAILGLHINTGQVLFTVDNYGNTSQENLVACGYLRDKVVVPCNQSLHVFRAETGEKILQIDNQVMGDEKFQCFDPISAQGHLVALATYGSPVLRVADIASGEFLHNRDMLDPMDPTDQENVCIYALAISPDQATIVFSSSMENDIYICDLVSLNTLRVIGGRNTDLFQKFNFTVDGRILYFPNGSMLTCVNLVSGKLKDRLVHPYKVTDIISRDLKTVVSVSSDNAVRVWNLINDNSDIFSDDTAEDLDIPNTGKRVKELTFLSVKADSGEETRVIQEFMFRQILPLPNFRYVLVQSEDVNYENLQIYDVIKRRPVRNARLLSDAALTACDVTLVDTTSAVLTTGSRRAYLVDLSTMTIIRKLQGIMSQYGSDMIVRKKEKEAFTFTRGRSHVKVYSLQTGLTTAVIRAPVTNKLSAMMKSPNDQLVAVSTEFPGPMLLFSAKDRVVRHILGPQELRCYASLHNAFFTKCGAFLMLNVAAVPPGIGGSESYYVAISTKTGKVEHHLIDRRDYNNYLNDLSDCRVSVGAGCHLREMLVLVGSEDGVIRLWELSTGQLLRRLRGHTHGISSLSVSSQGTKFVSHSSNKQDGAFRLWNAQTFQCVASFKGDNEVSHIQLLPHSDLILGGDTMTREVVSWSLEGCGKVAPNPKPGPMDFKGENLNLILKLDEPEESPEDLTDPDTDVDEISDEPEFPEEADSALEDTIDAKTGYDGDNDNTSRELSLDLSLR